MSDRGAAWALVGSGVATVALEHAPYAHVVARPLVWISTLAHEGGHGLTAVLVGAQWRGFQIFANGSGVASWQGSPGAVGRALIAAGGLVGPAIAAAALFLLARSARGARIGLGLLAAALALSLVTVVNSVFTFAVVAVLAALLAGSAWALPDEANRFVAAFFGVQLALSVFSRSDYLWATVAKTGAGAMMSDTAQMAAALWLPAWFWGALCGAFSIAVLGFGVWGAVAGSGGTPTDR